MRRLTILLALALSGALAAADEPLTVDLARGAARATSPAGRAAAAEAEAAAARARKARAFRLPSVDLVESYYRTDSPAEAFALQLNQERFDMQAFFSANPNDPAPLTTWTTRLELRQPLYTGGKLGARIDQAGLIARAADLRRGHTRAQVGFAAITAFVNLAKARENLELVSKARTTTAEHVRLAEAYAGEGIILDAEVLRAKVYLAAMDELVARAANGATLAEAALNFELGADQGRARSLAPLPPPSPVLGDLGAAIARALDRRGDLLAARREMEAGRLEERVERSGFLPEIALLARHDLVDERAFGGHGDSTSLMTMARVNLFRGGGDRAGLAGARHQSEAYAEQIHRFEEGVRLEVRQAWHELETARLRRATASQSLTAAREALRIREQRFKQGLDKMIDLLDAETALREAELREMVARYDIALATYRLRFVSALPLTEQMEESHD